MGSVYQGEDELLDVLEVFALTDDPLFVIDDRHRIVFWNRAVQKLLGYTHDEVAGRACSAVLAGDDAFGNRYCSDGCPVQLIARRGGSVKSFRLWLRAKDHTLLPVEVSVLRFTLRVSKRQLIAHTIRVIEDGLALAAAAPPLAAAASDPRGHQDARVRELTTREIEILGMLAAGRNARSIAQALNISPLTTRNHIQHIFEKLEVHSRSEAVAFAWRMQIV